MTSLYALLVAINEYPDPDHALNGCINDMNALHEYLKVYCEQAAISYQFKLLANEDASRDNLIAGFDFFQEAKPGDSCLFFYAGHGARWAAPEAFWHIEPDRYNESLVLHDSRTEGGRDLMDKELSYLIWKATHKRDVHFLAITDCCHSGTITRLLDNDMPLLCERRIEKVDTAIPLDEYLGIEEYPKTDTGQLFPPRGRYIHLAASRASQTAKEVYAKGIPHGAFSYFLVDSLRNSGGLISYAELLNRINIYVRNQVRDQSPQLDATEVQDKNLAFLTGDAHLKSGHFLLSYSRALGWNVNAGAMHQVQVSEEPTQFELLEGKHPIIAATKVLLNKCSVQEVEGIDKTKIYPVRMIPRPPQPLPLCFAANNEPDGQAILLTLMSRKSSSLYNLVSSAEEAEYLMHCRNNSYYLTSTLNDRPLFKRTFGYQEATAIDFLNQLETISQWFQLLKLSNPGTSIPEKEITVELYRGTEPGNDQNDAPMEEIDWREMARLSYLSDGNEWHRPAFQLKVTNNGKRNFWISILYMGDDFSISNQLMPMQRLEPGQFAWASEVFEGETYHTHRLAIDEIYQKWGISKIHEYFKIIVGTQEFDTHNLNQEGLELDRPSSPMRRLDTRHAVPRFDWTTMNLLLQLERPLPMMQLTADCPVEMFNISILPSPNLQASAQWLTLEEATDARTEHFNAYLPDGTYYCPADMGPKMSRPGLCVLQLSSIQTTANTPTTLTLTFEESDKVDGLQPYLWEMESGRLTMMKNRRATDNSLIIFIPDAYLAEEEVNIFFHEPG